MDRRMPSPRSISKPSMAARTGSNKAAFPPNWAARAAWLGFAAFFFYAASRPELTPARFVAGLGHAGKFLARLLPPGFHRWGLLAKGMIGSPPIAVLASTPGG